MVASPENIQRIDHLALLTSDHSTRDLVESLRDFMRLTLLSLLDETPSSINNTKRVLLDFAVGGILSLLSHWPSMRHTVTLREVQNRDVAVLAMGLYVSMSRRPRGVPRLTRPRLHTPLMMELPRPAAPART